MKDKLIHVCFVIDSSGSMAGSEGDVIGGFKKTIEEQKAVKDGECIVSLYEFASRVKQVFLGKKLDEVEDLDYTVGGMTRLYDGIGTAVDDVGKWLANMDESERPSKNLIVIITDGGENSSTEYRLKEIRQRNTIGISSILETTYQMLRMLMILVLSIVDSQQRTSSIITTMLLAQDLQLIDAQLQRQMLH